MAALSLIAAIVVAQPAPESPAAATTTMWIERPSMSREDYPPAALSAGQSGMATLQCNAAPDGTPNGCIVLNEDPPDYGFGAAAIRVVERSRLSPDFVAATEQPATFRLRIPFALAMSVPVVIIPGPETGSATVRCRLAESGQATGCAAESEVPAGQGLAAQAIAFLENTALPQGLVSAASPGQEFTVQFRFGEQQR